MKRRLWKQPIAWGVALLILIVLGVGAVIRAREPASHIVTIDAARFDPAVSIVRVGDTITWINKDLVPHTATSQTGGFDSGMIEPGNSWTYTATRAGEFRYICAYHPTMVALLRVK
jgi:plastocyanin